MELRNEHGEILPDLNLDVLDEQLHALFRLSEQVCTHLMTELKNKHGVSDSYSHRPPSRGESYLGDSPAFAAYATSIAYELEQYRFGDTDYRTWHIDRAVLEGTKTVAQWAEEIVAEMAAEAKRRIEENERSARKYAEAAEAAERAEFKRLKEKYSE